MSDPKEEYFQIHPDPNRLISYECPSIIKLNQDSGYKIKDRLFERDFVPFMSDDYRDMHIDNGSIPNSIIYSGAEHGGRDDKLPNITVLPNINVNSRKVFGSTMGHHQGTEELETQEIYEFGGHGAMVIDKDHNGVTFYFARNGDKIMVPSFCNMTIYNLDMEPLVTYDFSDPSRNGSTKNLQREIGPIFLIYHEGQEVVFKINEKYYNRDDGAGMKIGKISGDKTIRVRVYSACVDELYDKLWSPSIADKFWEHGIMLRPAEQSPLFEGKKIHGSLFDKKNLKRLRGYFFE